MASNSVLRSRNILRTCQTAFLYLLPFVPEMVFRVQIKRLLNIFNIDQFNGYLVENTCFRMSKDIDFMGFFMIGKSLRIGRSISVVDIVGVSRIIIVISTCSNLHKRLRLLRPLKPIQLRQLVHRQLNIITPTSIIKQIFIILLPIIDIPLPLIRNPTFLPQPLPQLLHRKYLSITIHASNIDIFLLY